MAHSCPECGRYCTCNGDWDDIDMGESSSCSCTCWMEDPEEEDDYPYPSKTVPLAGGGSATVHPDASPELIDALQRMVEIAKKTL